MLHLNWSLFISVTISGSLYSTAPYKEPDIVTEIKRNRLRWIGLVERMEDSRSVKKIFKGKPEGKERNPQAQEEITRRC
jgi:hypothetical protein